MKNYENEMKSRKELNLEELEAVNGGGLFSLFEAAFRALFPVAEKALAVSLPGMPKHRARFSRFAELQQFSRIAKTESSDAEKE